MAQLMGNQMCTRKSISLKDGLFFNTDTQPGQSFTVGNTLALLQEGDNSKHIPNTITIQECETIDNVIISPKFLEFENASEGMTMRKSMVIQNVGDKPAFIRIFDPNSIAFKIETLKRGISLCPGLSIKRRIVYTYQKTALLHALMPIQINGIWINYHLLCSLPAEKISIEPLSIDFGIFDIGFPSSIKLLTIHNEGGKSTKFSIDLGQNELELHVHPLKGIIKSKKSVSLKLEMVARKEGTFFSEFWIKSTPNIRVPLTAQVIQPQLKLSPLNVIDNFHIINFKSTYVNDKNYEKINIENISSEVCHFIAFGEIGNELLRITDIDTEKYPEYCIFTMTPVEGKIEPFEDIDLLFEFSPTPELLDPKKKGKNTEARDFVAFITIARLKLNNQKFSNSKRSKSLEKPNEEVSNLTKRSLEEPKGDVYSKLGTEFKDAVTIHLHGKAEFPKLQFVPDALYLNDMEIEESRNRVLLIKNPSRNLPITFEFTSNIAARCKPKKKTLFPEKSMEVLITICRKYNVKTSFKLGFDIIIQTFDGRKSSFKKMDTFFVPCVMSFARITAKKPIVKFSKGITPLITNEVGLNTDLATFQSNIEKPRQAMLYVSKDPSKKWANKKLLIAKAIPDSIPAYPNDTQRSLRPWKGPLIKTIFTGKSRYTSSPNLEETFNEKELKLLLKHRNYWKNYLKSLQKKNKVQNSFSCNIN